MGVGAYSGLYGNITRSTICTILLDIQYLVLGSPEPHHMPTESAAAQVLIQLGTLGAVRLTGRIL